MISIVMAHYNRLSLLDFTLSTINKSQHKDYEVIIVDDFSDDSENPTQLITKYPNMDIIVIEMKDRLPTRNYVNPCILYNVGFQHAKGDKIIIQNPECCHMGDVIKYTEKTLSNNIYLVFHCYASTENELKTIHSGNTIPLPTTKSHGGDGTWRIHKSLRPEIYHYTTAISRNRLRELNGFDERFGDGYAVDDDEFAFRVNRLLPSIQYVGSPYVIHQYHHRVYSNGTSTRNSNLDPFKNLQLFIEMQNTTPVNVRAHNDGKQIIGEST